MFTNEWETSAFQFRLYLRDVCIFVCIGGREGLVIASMYIYIIYIYMIYIWSNHLHFAVPTWGVVRIHNVRIQQFVTDLRTIDTVSSGVGIARRACVRAN